MTPPDTSAAQPSPASYPPTPQRVDDEPLRLVTSFNDIFVVIAAWLLSFGTVFLTGGLPSWLQMLIATAITWGLSEIFVRRRRMALPALCFAFSFVSTAALLGFGNASLLHQGSETVRASMSVWTLAATAVCTLLAAALYWWRFRVPAVIAMGLAGVVIVAWAHALVLDAQAVGGLLVANIVAGLAIFIWALRWDAQDPQRITIRSDVAFWLHLLAACMVTHPIFWMLAPHHPGAVIAVFLVLTAVSLAIDRRGQVTDQRRLARSDLAGNDDEALALGQAEAEIRHRLPVRGGLVPETRIGGQRERPAGQSVMVFVHRRPACLSGALRNCSAR